jgi:hypothetical protein
MNSFHELGLFIIMHGKKITQHIRKQKSFLLKIFMNIHIYMTYIYKLMDHKDQYIYVFQEIYSLIQYTLKYEIII